MSDSSILQLRRLATGKPAYSTDGYGFAATGHAGIDKALGGGLARGRLHELFAAGIDDASSVAGFAAMLARQLGGGIVWLREEQAERQGGALYAPGLAEIGIDPVRLILGVLPDPLAVLRAAADVMRCPEAGVVVIELWHKPRMLDLTASRRLVLSLESSGITALMLRIAADPAPSAAQTRWLVRTAPARPLEANAPGPPALEVELLRQRGNAAGGKWQLEWDRECAIFRSRDWDNAAAGAALSGAVVPLPAGRPADTDSAVRLRRAG